MQAIREWIANDNERAADQVVARIVQTAMMFGQFPMLGRPGKVADTREFSVVRLPYLIVYRIASETETDVLTVLHTRRRYPPE
ncbi:MAG: type II toxin-antitoxin system RelE/ParE family toxin [Sphingomonas sp.]|nr:type II toxin-antitoxin system RelE/ParE family toxin [Sphingomonas sp.]